MDMTDNQSWFVNGHWTNDLGFGTIDLKADYRATFHQMNFLADKGGSNPGMPMNTHVQSGGYTAKLDIPVVAEQTLRVGNEYHAETMNDWWPAASATSMMMGPNTFINVNNGQRNRLGFFAELESRWSDRLTTVAGGRFDRVTMNTGNVAPYSWTSMMQMADQMAANAFNAASHQRTDQNWEGSLLASYTPTNSVTIEGGYAHKTQSPNLYERYTWGQGGMASMMIGWFGDGNGYFGNLNLKPERADTLSASAELRGQGKAGWFLKAAPYYTHVNDYIDATYVKNLVSTSVAHFNQLQFNNEEAEFYGIDVSGALPVLTSAYGQTKLTGSLAYVHGENLSAHTPLYHQMPLNAKVAASQHLGAFDGAIEVQWVDSKTRVDPSRVEATTAAYTLVNLRTGYNWRAFRFSVDVENLLDKAYFLPLGGESLGDYKAGGRTSLRATPGRGRSVNVGLTARF